ncbi:MAG: DMT family transporter [candidate division Zixibacteria bacterium]|nr:DMT family transporter [candidate division Zixibacteria bacterium]
MSTIPYLGEILAFTTAIVWASAVIFFKKSGETVHPVGLNIFKGILSFTLIMITMWIVGDSLFVEAPAKDYIILLISGVLGIGLADTFFFKSLNLLGAGLSAIVDCLYSPFIISLSIIFLGESLGVLQIIGVVLIVGAVLTATNPQTNPNFIRHDCLWGIFWGASAMAAMAVGIVMVKPMLDYSSLLWVSQIRMIGGLASLGIILLFFPTRKKIIQSVVKVHSWKYMLPGSFLGAYVSLILWMAGFKYTQASIAAALNQTSNIFVFIFAAIFLKETITRQKTIGIVLGVTGVFLLMFSDIIINYF